MSALLLEQSALELTQHFEEAVRAGDLELALRFAKEIVTRMSHPSLRANEMEELAGWMVDFAMGGAARDVDTEVVLATPGDKYLVLDEEIQELEDFAVSLDPDDGTAEALRAEDLEALERMMAVEMPIGEHAGVDSGSADVSGVIEFEYDDVEDADGGAAPARPRSPSRAPRRIPPEAAPPTEGRVIPVWFGTNRQPLDAGGGFSAQRANTTTLGRVDVLVPDAHRFGETASTFLQKLRRMDFRDDALRIQTLTKLAADAFHADVRAAIEQVRQGGESPQALVFLHGFNVSFEDAAIRAAQLGFDLKIPGATAFFSWPSRGAKTAYTVDEASIEASERAITAFLTTFARSCGADKVHVIAHSMGNRGLLRALQRIAADAEQATQVKFGQIILAAPDIDRDLFLDLAEYYPRFAERTTLYSSSADFPVYLSGIVHHAPRAGHFMPHTVVAGIDTIAVPDYDMDLLGHSYFAQAEALLYDISDLIARSAAPGQRRRIDPLKSEGLALWQLRL